MNRKYTYTDLSNNTDAVAAAVIPLCNTDTDGIEDWLSNASTDVNMTARDIAFEWDSLSN